IEKYTPHMLLLDIILPEMDGYTFCKHIRETSHVPIIIISAKDNEVDKIIGLELGSDDYLTKPFSPRELVTRVKRLFARSQLTEQTDNKPRVIGDVEVYEEERRVFQQVREVDVTMER